MYQSYSYIDPFAVIFCTWISFCYLIYKLQPTAFPGKIMLINNTQGNEYKWVKMVLTKLTGKRHCCQNMYQSSTVIRILYMAAHWNWTNHSVGCSTILFTVSFFWVKAWPESIFKHSIRKYGIPGNLSTCGKENHWVGGSTVAYT